MGRLCSIDSGSSNAQDAVDNAPYVLFDRSKKIKRSTRYLFDCEALIIPGEGTEFLPRYFIGKFDLHQRAYALHSFSEKIDVRYLYYYLIYLKDYWPRVAVGATVKSLRRRHFENLPVTVAPRDEQQRIVAILDEAFAGLAIAAANAEKNLKNARELFASYLNSIFTLKGEGWEENVLGDIADFKNGLNFTKNSKGEKIKIVGVKDFQNNYWVPMQQLEPAQIDGKLSDAYLLQKGDILTVRSNGNKQLIGRCILASDVPDKTSHSGFTIRIRVKSPDVTPAYLVHYLKSDAIRRTLIESGDGTNISSLNQQALSALPVSVPPASVQIDIVTRIDAIEAEAGRLEAAYQQKIDDLAELKQSILQKAFSGELTSPPSQAIQEAAE
jgi:type I restriction enzyme S subunit